MQSMRLLMKQLKQNQNIESWLGTARIGLATCYRHRYRSFHYLSVYRHQVVFAGW